MAGEPEVPITWLQLRFDSEASTAAGIAELLTECGALAVTLDDAKDAPIYEPDPGTTPLWPSTRVSGLFPGERDPGALLTELARRYAPGHLPDPSVERLADEDWVRRHRDAFRPTCFGDRVWVVPSWADPPVLEPGQVTLTLDPGLAFGTGSHATTHMCLDWLAREPAVAGGDVVDYGCGSGILALAAARLGARRVWAVDNDAQALDATRRNAVANGLADRVTVSTPDALPSLTADIVLANILANTLIDLVATLSAMLAPRGQLVLGGILEDQSDRVREAVRRADLVISRNMDRDGWRTLVACPGGSG